MKKIIASILNIAFVLQMIEPAFATEQSMLEKMQNNQEVQAKMGALKNHLTHKLTNMSEKRRVRFINKFVKVAEKLEHKIRSQNNQEFETSKTSFQKNAQLQNNNEISLAEVESSESDLEVNDLALAETTVVSTTNNVDQNLSPEKQEVLNSITNAKAALSAHSISDGLAEALFYVLTAIITLLLLSILFIPFLIIGGTVILVCTIICAAALAWPAFEAGVISSLLIVIAIGG